MGDATMKCPNCGHAFPLTDAARRALRGEVEAALLEQQLKLREEDKTIEDLRRLLGGCTLAVLVTAALPPGGTRSNSTTRRAASLPPLQS